MKHINSVIKMVNDNIPAGTQRCINVTIWLNNGRHFDVESMLK